MKIISLPDIVIDVPIYEFICILRGDIEPWALALQAQEYRQFRELVSKYLLFYYSPLYSYLGCYSKIEDIEKKHSSCKIKCKEDWIVIYTNRFGVITSKCIRSAIYNYTHMGIII